MTFAYADDTSRHVIGKITCERTIGYRDLNVCLFNSKNSGFLAEAHTNQNGEFSFRNIEPDNSYLIWHGHEPCPKLIHYWDDQLITVPSPTQDKIPMSFLPLFILVSAPFPPHSLNSEGLFRTDFPEQRLFVKTRSG